MVPGSDKGHIFEPFDGVFREIDGSKRGSEFVDQERKDAFKAFPGMDFGLCCCDLFLCNWLFR